MRIPIRILCAFALGLMTVGPVSAATIKHGPVLIAQAQAATVSGRITDSQTGGPVVNATVSLKGPANYTATTDASGGFSIPNVTPGVYSVSVTKPGYNALTQDTFAIVPGSTPNIVGTLQPITFTTLRTIASVRSTARGTFNVTPASVNVVTAATLQQQGQTQVMQVLNQTPGIVANFPSTSANGADPGSITFPNIRGALSFETASLIDGHPVSVGTFGDYVTTFVPAFTMGAIEVIKGPGAESPNVNYAIGGTVNFTTKEPTYVPQGELWLGADTRGSTLLNFDFTGTAGRWGYAFALSNNNLSSALEGNQAIFSPSGGIINFNGTTGTALAFNDSSTTIPGTISTNFTNFNLVACCDVIRDLFQQKSYLAKLRYRLSPVTSATFTYLGAQSFVEENGVTGDLTAGGFFSTSSASYSGSIPNNSSINEIFLHAGTDREIQNEPILMGDLRTSSGNDTLLARYYSAGIHRLVDQGSTSPFVPEVLSLQLYGNDTASKQTFNGQTVPVVLYNYFNQAEDDVLHGWSLEWDHPFSATNSLTMAVDQDVSTTVSYSISSSVSTFGATCNHGFNVACVSPSTSVTIPKGSSQLFTTVMGRYQTQLSAKWNASFAGYYNIYNSTYPVAPAVNPNPPPANLTCNFNGVGCVFGNSIHNHLDERVALEYRPNGNTALRFSAGSAIAPPYLQLLSGLTGTITCGGSPQNCNTSPTPPTQRINTGNLQPETAFGYDAGGDYRFPDGVTTLSGDVYLTNLRNHFLTYTYDSGTTCPATDPVTGGPTPTGCAGKELFFTSNRNLADARMEGVELSIRRRPSIGFGYVIQGSMQRGYAYNLPACFYSTTITKGVPDCTKFNTNLAIIPGQNFTGAGISGNGCGCNGFSNQAIPYSQGYFELNYAFPGGASAYIGDQFTGKNNSEALPPFWLLSAGMNVPLGNGLALQVNGFNLTNAYSGVWPSFGGGVPIPIAGLPPQAPANSPLYAATQAQVFGPSRVQFSLIKRFGAGGNPTNP